MYNFKLFAFSTHSAKLSSRKVILIYPSPMDMSFYFSSLCPMLVTTSFFKKNFFSNSIEIEKNFCFEKLFLKTFWPLTFLDTIVLWYNTITLCFGYLVGSSPALVALEQFEGRACPIHLCVSGCSWILVELNCTGGHV